MSVEKDPQKISDTIVELEGEVNGAALDFLNRIPPLADIWIQSREPLELLVWTESPQQVHQAANDYPVVTKSKQGNFVLVRATH